MQGMVAMNGWRLIENQPVLTGDDLSICSGHAPKERMQMHQSSIEEQAEVPAAGWHAGRGAEEQRSKITARRSQARCLLRTSAA